MGEELHNSGTGIALAFALPVFFGVFMLVVVTLTLITFILPESYMSVARIRLSTSAVATQQSQPAIAIRALDISNEVEVLKSERILGVVIEKLDLGTEWGRRYLNGEQLRTQDAVEVLRRHLDIHPVPSTEVISIAAYDEKPGEAAQLANAVVAAYSDYSLTAPGGLRVDVLDSARPALRPARPNKPLNIVLGIVLGLILGIGAGGLAGLIAYRWKRAARRT
jgi:uncharacterized protein involved in exopolysaccharide biosynthesis